MTAYLITVGDEILIGQIVDTNAAWMAQQLNLQGIRLVGKTSVGDVHNHIVQAIEEGLQKADLVLMTGGLGATKDDITKKAIAAHFDVPMVFHQPTFERLTYFFQRLQREVTEINKNGCFMPENADILTNDRGLAPGMWFEKGEKVLVSMPGVPYEMQHLMTDRVLPRLKAAFPMSPIVHRTVLTAGEGETMLAEKLENFESALPEHIKLAYLPALGSVRLRLTARGTDEAQLNADLDRYQSQMEALVGTAVAGYDTDTMPQILGRLLKERGLTIGCAESCTGGFLSHLITAIPGSSAYFEGSIVSYANQIKQNILKVAPETLDTEGAVSEACVIEMVAGARQALQVDIAVAASGIAGPGGDTPDKPVGTIWLAVGDGTRIKTTKLGIDRGRQKNIEYAANVALNLVRKFLLESEKV